jgi:putative transposase
MRTWHRARLYPTRKQSSIFDTYLRDTNRIRELAKSDSTEEVRARAKGLSDSMPLSLVYGVIRRGGRNPTGTITFGRAGPQWAMCRQRQNYNTFQVRIARIGNVLARGRISNAEVLAIGSENGKWYGYFLVPDEPPIKRRRRSIGIDLGTGQTLVTLSNGIRLSPHREVRRLQRKLSNLQRKEREQVQGSTRHATTLAEIERTKARIKACQIGHAHRVTDFLTRHYSVIGIEKLNGSGTQAAINAGWSHFLTILHRKARRRGITLVAVNAAGTSTTCSVCGARHQKMPLSDREFTCLLCSYSDDRDVNAAKNIRARALSRLTK